VAIKKKRFDCCRCSVRADVLLKIRVLSMRLLDGELMDV